MPASGCGTGRGIEFASLAESFCRLVEEGITVFCELGLLLFALLSSFASINLHK